MIYNRNGVAWARIGGRRVSLHVPFADKAQHQQALAKALAAPVEQPAGVTLGFACNEALRLHYRGQVGKNQQAQAKVDELLEFFGKDTPLAQIGSKRVAEWKLALAAKGNTGSTINRKIAVLSKVLHLAEEWELIDKLPVMHREKENDGRLVWLTPEQERAILAKLPDRWYAACVTMIDTGMRPSELRRHDRSRDLHANGSVSIWKSKGGTPRTVPLSSRAYDLLLGTNNFGWMTEDKLVQLFDKLRQADVIPMDVTAYAMRHTFAVRMLEQGTDLFTLAGLMGHSKLETTRIYAHISDKLKREAVNRVEKAHAVPIGVPNRPDRAPVARAKSLIGQATTCQRTGAAGVNSPSLYRLSYQGIVSESSTYASGAAVSPRFVPSRVPLCTEKVGELVGLKPATDSAQGPL